MDKLLTITQEQLDVLQKRKNPVKYFKELASIDTKLKYGMGDTMIRVDDANRLDLFKSDFKGKSVYYLILERIDETTAFAYSLYPM